MAAQVFGQLKRQAGMTTGVEVFVDRGPTDNMHARKLHPLFPSADIDPQRQWFYDRAHYVPPTNLPYPSSVPPVGYLGP